MSDLDIDRVSVLLAELGERLAGRGIEGEIYVVGGAAMMLAYDGTRITRDIDAVGVPQEEIDAEVQAMAADHRDLDPDWLNARVLPLLPRGIDGGRLQVLGGPGLTVNVASPKWLLAMKARAARGRRDLDDIWVLCQIIGIRTTDEVWAICDDVWGEGMLREDVIDLVTTDLQARGLR
ncbi:MAG TPA: DUF6036 family nucleotidyltransferase [Candidatus Nanopelagicales bacterium]|nr:DUF6036 family nucleotidyltransferase [Candidatus Nanopelagicales bacterium]